MNREEALSILRAQDLQRFHVRSLSLFGSVARNMQTASSDIDLLVEFEGPTSYDNYIELKFHLEELLGQPVDLVMARALKPRMRSSVERDLVRVA